MLARYKYVYVCIYIYIYIYINSDAHAQRIIGNDVIVIPPHDFERPSRLYYRV
jgi:hypothetical protein